MALPLPSAGRRLSPPVTDAQIVALQSGEITFWNHGAETIFGYDALEVTGRPVGSVLTIPRLGSAGSYRVEAIRKDGRAFRAGVVVEPFTSGSQAAVSIAVRDESRWMLFADVIGIFAEHDNFSQSAPRVAEVIGATLGFDAVAVWTLDEGQPHRIVWWSASGEPVRESGLVEGVIETGETATSKDAMVFAILDGALELFCAPGGDIETSARNDLARIAAAASRFRLRERNSRDLREAHETRRLASLGELAATMAHEFNNVMMSIATFAEVLKRKVAGDTQVQLAVTNIQQSLGRGRRLTEEILRFKRDPKPILSTIDVRRWLHDFTHEAQALTKGRAEIEAVDPLFIAGDIALLNQVLANLLINAYDAAPSGPIRIAARRSEGMLDLAITDRGSGIAPQIRERIFEPLFTTKRSGTGLGLAIVRRVIHAHGGTISVKSEPEEGTEFHLRLPLVDALGKDEPEPQGRPTRALLVEDDPAVTAALKAMLESEGLQLRTVANGQAALKAIEREVPDVVLLDVGLPDVSGVDLYGEIDQRWPRLPVVFITAQSDDREVARFLQRPHIGFLQKPFEAAQLLEVLSRLATGKRPDSERIPSFGRHPRSPP